MQSKKLVLGNHIVSYGQGSSQDKNNTLVFLHGWMQDKSSFIDIFQMLEEKKISYISLDLPGFGSTPLINHDMQIEDYGTFVIQFIEKIGLEKPTLVGHSFGGRISIYLGSFYTNIEKIVLIGAAGVGYKMNPMRYIIVKSAKIFFSIPGLGALGKYVKKGFSSPDYKDAGKMEKIFRNTISNDLQVYMKQIFFSTLMIWGDRDGMTPLSEGKTIHEHIKSSELHILEGTHFIHQEKPEEVSKLILDFMEK